MHVLVSNDDGIYAPGIKALMRSFADAGIKVTVVAPDRERSAVGHGITIHNPLRITPHSENEGITAYAVSGTPADCVKLAIENLLIDSPPDIVVSGINRGPNLGTDVIYSGTVSAAVEGAILGIPAIAVSLGSFRHTDYSVAAGFAMDCIQMVQKKGLPEDTVLNINVPAIPPDQISGVKVTKLGSRRYENTFVKRTDPAGRDYFWMSGELVDIDNDDDTDVCAVKQNFISVTPMHFDLTNYRLIREVSGWQMKYSTRED